MKIAYIIPSLLNKGPIIVAHTLVCNLVDKVELIDVYYFDEIYGIDFPCNTIKINLKSPIKFDDYDIIHAHMLRPDRYISKWKHKIKKAKTVTTLHQDIFGSIKLNDSYIKALILSPIWYSFMRKFDCSVPISNELYLKYKRKIPNLSFAIHNGISINYQPKQFEEIIESRLQDFKMNDYKIISTYCTIFKSKGIDQLLKLTKARKDIVTIIIGEGPEKNNLQKLTEEYYISDRVFFLPYAKNPYNFLKLADIYVMPSRNEGFGLALIEVAFTKTPIICSDIPIFHEIFNSEEALFFELDNINSLSSAVDKCIAEKESLIKNAYNRVSKHFSGAVMANKYYEVYKKLIS